MNQTPSHESVTCQRCGACCENGGPALHSEDLHLVESGALRRRDLVTIRIGEPAVDQRQGRAVPAAHEFVKLSGARGSWRCKFFEESRGCGIYGQRPLECRLLFCRDTAPVEAVMGRDLLNRRDLLAGDDPVMPWLERLEREAPFAEVVTVLAELANPGALARLTSLVRVDLANREAFLGNFPDREAEELFLLGRPLFLALAPYGIRLAPGPTGVGLQWQRPGC